MFEITAQSETQQGSNKKECTAAEKFILAYVFVYNCGWCEICGTLLHEISILAKNVCGTILGEIGRKKCMW